MMVSLKTRYLLVFLGILTGSAIELARGYRPLIVVMAFLSFLIVGFALIFVSSAKERELARRKKRAYYAGETE